MASGGTSDDMILKLLHSGARNGTLLSSCEPEVKELMHQLDTFISVRCGQWEEQVSKLKILLKKKEDKVELLQVALEEKEKKEKKLKSTFSKQEREHRAHSADCEAQLVRLRSQVTRLSQSFEHLKAKRHHEHDREGKATKELLEMKQELERTNHFNKELKKALMKRENQSMEVERRKQSEQSAAERLLKEIAFDVEERMLGEEACSLQPAHTKETPDLLTELLDKHFQLLHSELLKILET